MSNTTKLIKIIDSHTGGEPTRVVVDGCPHLGDGTLAQKRDLLKAKYDWIRTTVLLEPRGFPAMVGAIITEPHSPDCTAGVIFFNNAGYLNMCIHGTIGLAITLKHMGIITTGSHRIDTPVGVVTAHMHDDGSVSVDNVPSYCHQADALVEVPHYGTITGDIAWGGNWFFLIDEQKNVPAVEPSNIPLLTEFTTAVMAALADQGIAGGDGQPIDHIELFGPPADDQSDSRNFVLCPGGEYDRSPCGTGTSAKLACLYESGKLNLGEIWRQSSIINTIFTGKVTPLTESNQVTPTITGSAWVNGETTIIINPEDPFATGINF
ncbi:MAG: proline racemase family protein [Akkermansiaceae bacterium]